MPYRRPPWLVGAHAQTIWPLLVAPKPPAYRRERWDTPDGDFIDLDWIDPTDGDVPLLVMFHGLEGSSGSPYATATMHAVARLGWAGVVAHFRGCSGEINRLPRAYHSGDSDEMDWILRRLRARAPERPIFVVGISLGGNVLLKWLGERGDEASRIIDAAAAVCAPLDLAACGHHLARGFNRVYTRHFLGTLKATTALRAARHPGLVDLAAVKRASNLYEFDNAVTAPLHGFRDTDDYWRRASSRPWLRAIRLPTLVLNAVNDPFIPTWVLPKAHEVAAPVRLEQPAEGGHVGFVTGSPPGQIDWLPQRLLHFFRNEL